MGWQSDDMPEGHEGYVVAVLADGTEPPPVPVRVSPIVAREGFSENSAWWLYDGREGRPRAFAVKAACQCGWRSADMFPVDFDDWEKTDGWEDSTGPNAAWWNQHVGRVVGDRIPDDVAEAIDALRVMLAALADSRPLAAVAAAARVEKLGTARLQHAVTSAVRTGASWTAIGNATGTTRQAAHQRFSKVPF